MRVRFYISLIVIILLSSYTIFKETEIRSLKKHIVTLEAEYQQVKDELSDTEQKLEDAKIEFEDINN